MKPEEIVRAEAAVEMRDLAVQAIRVNGFARPGRAQGTDPHGAGERTAHRARGGQRPVRRRDVLVPGVSGT